MKCELCHKNNAETAIEVNGNDGARELYVCKQCAKSHKRERAAVSTLDDATDEISSGHSLPLPPGVSISMSGIIGPDGRMTTSGNAGDIPSQVLDMLDNFIKKIRRDEDGNPDKTEHEDWPLVDGFTYFPDELVLFGRVSLQALHLEGRIEELKKFLHEKNVELTGLTVDNIPECGHIYELRHNNLDQEELQSVLEEVLEKEMSARDVLLQDDQCILGDALCRAIAVLKNCRLLTPGEFLDLTTVVIFGLNLRYVSGIDELTIRERLLELECAEALELDGEAEKDKDPLEREIELADSTRAMFRHVKMNSKARKDGLL